MMIAKARRALRAFLPDRTGNVAITFGIAVIPVLGAVGAAVDYSLASRAKTTLDAYADAAALSAVNTNALNMTANAAEKQAAAFFKAQAEGLTLRQDLGPQRRREVHRQSPHEHHGHRGVQQHRHQRNVDRRLGRSKLYRLLSVAR
jgi:hypothetical protein